MKVLVVKKTDLEALRRECRRDEDGVGSVFGMKVFTFESYTGPPVLVNPATPLGRLWLEGWKAIDKLRQIEKMCAEV